MATTAPPDSPVPTTDPTPPAPIKSGFATSEFWVKVMCSIAGILLASGVIPTTGQWTQISTILGLLAGSAMYTHGRSKLKVAAINGGKAPANENVSINNVASTAGVFALVAMLSFGHAGCSGTSVTTTLKNGGISFLQCEKVNLQQIIDGKTSLIATVVIDLASANYAGAISSTIAKVGGDAVGCAVLAIEQVFGAGKAAAASAGSGAGSGSGPTLLPALADSPIAARAREMMTAYNWRTPTTQVTP